MKKFVYWFGRAVLRSVDNEITGGGEMSILPMFKKCVHCGRRYTFNPSVGRFGWVCPHCGRPQRSAKQEQTAKEMPDVLVDMSKKYMR